MESVYSSIKAFVLETLGTYLEPLADESTPLPAPAEKDIVFGVADLTRYENKLLCVITPDAQEEAEGEIGGVIMRTTCTVSFLCRGAQYDVLMRKMCRYAAAFRRAVQNDSTMGGAFQNVSFEKTDFFPDAGTTEKQMTAAEMTITVEAAEEIKADTTDTEDW
ncbi:MAG: hypothetical protein K6G80_00090 [Treponema sp.]|nr:hypothetical protein [Treponema sp.]